MSNLTVQERVLQAVNRAYALVAERQAATATLQAAKQAEDKVRLESAVATVDKAATASRDATIRRANETYKPAMAKALTAIQQAQNKYNSILSQKNESEAVAQAEYEKLVEQAKQEHKTRMATAHATVVSAESAVAVLQTTLDQHNRQVQEGLGIDMSKLAV